MRDLTAAAVAHRMSRTAAQRQDLRLPFHRRAVRRCVQNWRRPSLRPTVRIAKNVRLVSILYLAFHSVSFAGCRQTSQSAGLTLSSDDVEEVVVTLVDVYAGRKPTTTSVRSKDRSAIELLLSAIAERRRGEDCKCPYYGDLRLRGPRVDIRVEIMPGQSPEFYELHETDHTVWKVPRDRFIEALERLGATNVPR